MYEWHLHGQCVVFTQADASWESRLDLTQELRNECLQAIDAIAFSIHLQEELMEVAWPEDLLLSPHACPDTSATGTKLFAGLRVRCAIHTGITDSIKVCKPMLQSACLQSVFANDWYSLQGCAMRYPLAGARRDSTD